MFDIDFDDVIQVVLCIIAPFILCCIFIVACDTVVENKNTINEFVSDWNYTATPLDYDENGYDFFCPITNDTGINIKYLSVDALIYNNDNVRTDTCNLTIEHWKDGEIVYFDRYTKCDTTISKVVFVVNSFEEE